MAQSPTLFPGQPPQRRERRTIALYALLFALLLLLPLGGAGCAGNPFAPQPQVADDAAKVFQDGKDKEAAAQKDLDSNRRDDAAKAWGDTAAYYQAVARKFNGSENGLHALVLQSEAQQKQVEAATPVGSTHNYTTAQITLRNALREYPAAAFASNPTALAAREKAQAEYQDLVARMDDENSKSFFYKVMDGLVRLFGGNPEVAPVVAIVFIAVAVNAITWPLIVKQLKSGKEMARYQPELKRIQEKYKADPAEAMQRQQAFMKEHGINQFAGCLPMLAQWPVTMLMYEAIAYYQFHFRNSHFLWVNPAVGDMALSWPAPLTGIIGHNLSEQDYPLLIVYALSMWAQAKLTPMANSASTDPQVVEQQKMMANFMPIMFFVMMLQWQPPAAFVLYWLISIILGAARYYFINRSLPDLPPLVLNSEGQMIDGAGGAAAMRPMGANPKLVSPKNRPKKK